MLRCIALFLAWLVAGHAAEPVPLEALAAPLLKAQTYCESGKWGASIGPDQPLDGSTYRVCAHRDGRFKFVQHPGQAQQLIFWSDNRTLHRYVPYGRAYQTYPLGESGATHEYGNAREAAPALHSRLFRWATRTGAGLDLAGSLRDYRVNPALSDDRQLTYERFDRDGRGGSRIRVHAADGSLVRYEMLYGGVVRGFVEITSREVDRPLTEDDLAYAVPVTARFSLQNNAPVFIAALFVATTLAGLAFWSVRFSGSRGLGDFAATRRRLWLYFALLLGVVGALLGLLAVATWGGSGHPPAIVYVMVLALWAAVVFGLVACFLLTSYLAQVLVRTPASR